MALVVVLESIGMLNTKKEPENERTWISVCTSKRVVNETGSLFQLSEDMLKDIFSFIYGCRLREKSWIIIRGESSIYWHPVGIHSYVVFILHMYT